MLKLAIRNHGATRIGHGYRIVDDAALMEELKEKGIHLEICPTSSRKTGDWETFKREIGQSTLV